MKRIATMQDISCVGKCSLTVALPIISAMGIETAIMPTAVLSTHTMFKGFTFLDLTSQIEPIMDHWEKEGFKFDALYTGYLGSFEQLSLAASFFERFGKGVLKLVDPCMADNGKLYPGFTPQFARAMRDLCAKADVICPNMTEASFLLDIPYRENYDEEYCRSVLRQLTDIGAKRAVITGVSFENGKLGAYAYDSEKDEYLCYFNNEEPQHFHGTGDIWASVFLGASALGKPFLEAMEIACDFVKESIRLTLLEENHNEYGVNFEQALFGLAARLQ